MNVWQRSVVDEAGNVMPLASVEVRDQVTSGLIQLYSDYDGASAIGNPIAADADGFVRFYVAAGRYRIEATSGALTRVWENELVGVELEIGDSRSTITNDSSTDYTSEFQSLLSAAAGLGPVHVYKTQASGYIKLTGRVTAAAGTTIVLHDGVELRWTATTATGTSFLGSATRPGIEVTGDNFRIEGYGALTGPSTASYVGNECGIFMTGTSTSSRKSGFYVGGQIEFSKWGAYPILLNFVNRFDISGARIHDSGYIGIHLNSCNHGKVHHYEIYSLTPGTSSETHGISMSHDSTDYDIDANAATNGRLAANPFCQDIEIHSGLIYDCPLWSGIDAHGGYEIRVHHNNIYNCMRGIQIASGSGDAANYAGEKNVVAFNNITPRKRDGSATTVSGGFIYGITVNGGSVVEHRGVRVIGNDIDGCGDTSQTSSPITAVRVIGAVISGNNIRNWAGPGIYTSNGDGIISNNTFGFVSNATAARCIRLDSNSRTWTVVGNKLELNGGTAPAEGLRETTTTVKHTYIGNNFDAATTPYVGTTQTLTGAGAVDLVHEVTHVATTGANALTLAAGTENQEKTISMVTDGGDGTLTITNFAHGTTITFSAVGQLARLKYTGAKWYAVVTGAVIA